MLKIKDEEMLNFVEKAYNEGNMPVWDYEKFKEEFREKTAKEMFEKLGYEETFNNKYTLSYTLKIFISETHRIEFFKNTKQFICHCYSDSPFEPAKPFEVSMEELQAINKQVEELGWLRGEDNDKNI